MSNDYEYLQCTRSVLFLGVGCGDRQDAEGLTFGNAGACCEVAASDRPSRLRDCLLHLYLRPVCTRVRFAHIHIDIAVD